MIKVVDNGYNLCVTIGNNKIGIGTKRLLTSSKFPAIPWIKYKEKDIYIELMDSSSINLLVEDKLFR